MVRKQSTHNQYVCQSCGHVYSKWQGTCTNCENWNTIVELVEDKNTHSSIYKFRSGTANLALCQSLSEIASKSSPRFLTGIDSFDELIGGGIVAGGITLIGGEPGVGKSTFMLQLATRIADKLHPIIYITGEESLVQVKLRAERLRIGNENKIYIIAEQNLESALSTLSSYLPRLLIIDSIQTIYHPQIDSTPGSVTQIKECASIITKFGKDRGLPIFIVGHVTKEGYIAGPKLLEHIVDTVLYFEGDINSNFRLLRVFKNRFGASGEVAIFQMTNSGLVPISNPSDIFVSKERLNSAGVVVVPIIEGTRCILIELQTLVTQSYLSNPRRVSSGIDLNRLNLVIAVLEKHVGLKFYNKDVFTNIASGLKLTDPSGDVALAIALSSSLWNITLDKDALFIGELTLSGDIRPVSQLDRRITEAKRFGFKKFYIPYDCNNSNLNQLINQSDIIIKKYKSIKELINDLFDKKELSKNMAHIKSHCHNFPSETI